MRLSQKCELYKGHYLPIAAESELELEGTRAQGMRARLVSPFSDELATKDVLVHLIVFVACRCMCRLLARIVSTYCFHVLDGIDRHHLYRSMDDA